MLKTKLKQNQIVLIVFQNQGNGIKLVWILFSKHGMQKEKGYVIFNTAMQNFDIRPIQIF